MKSMRSQCPATLAAPCKEPRRCTGTPIAAYSSALTASSSWSKRRRLSSLPGHLLGLGTAMPFFSHKASRLGRGSSSQVATSWRMCRWASGSGFRDSGRPRRRTSARRLSGRKASSCEKRCASWAQDRREPSSRAGTPHASYLLAHLSRSSRSTSSRRRCSSTPFAPTTSSPPSRLSSASGKASQIAKSRRGARSSTRPRPSSKGMPRSVRSLTSSASPKDSRRSISSTTLAAARKEARRFTGSPFASQARMQESWRSRLTTSSRLPASLPLKRPRSSIKTQRSTHSCCSSDIGISDQRITSFMRSSTQRRSILRSQGMPSAL
mmetsp:Transcript_102994/g.229997  ORF Transcript_102994/g.229997 Transcript_102994/m.229997 type:complete len:323 (+) Transcript_102994:622-1590(+)